MSSNQRKVWRVIWRERFGCEWILVEGGFMRRSDAWRRSEDVIMESGNEVATEEDVGAPGSQNWSTGFDR